MLLADNDGEVELVILMDATGVLLLEEVLVGDGEREGVGAGELLGNGDSETGPAPQSMGK